MTKVEFDGIIDTVNRMFRESMSAVERHDWETFFRMDEEIGKALLYLQLNAPDPVYLFQLMDLAHVMDQRAKMVVIYMHACSPVADA